MHLYQKRMTAILLSSLFATSAYSSSPTNHLYTEPQQPQAIFQFGFFSANQGTSQDVSVQDLIGDHFSVTTGTKENGLIGFGYFIPGQTFSHADLLYGLNAFYLFSDSVSGKVTQENLFTNLAYSYTVSNLPIYAAVKALLKNNNNDLYNVTIDAGIGANIIQTSDFKESSLDGGITIPDKAFTGATTTAFSAMAGIGVRLNHLLRNTPIECGYRIFYLGQGELNSINSQIPDDLKTGHNYAQALVCGVVI